MKLVKFSVLIYSLLLTSFMTQGWGQDSDFSILYKDTNTELVASNKSSDVELKIKAFTDTPSESANMSISCYESAEKMVLFTFIWVNLMHDTNNEKYQPDEKCQFIFQVDEGLSYNEQWSYSGHLSSSDYMAFPVGPRDWPLNSYISGIINNDEYFSAEAEYRKRSEIFLSKIKKGQNLTVTVKLKNNLTMKAVFDISKIEKNLNIMTSICGR